MAYIVKGYIDGVAYRVTIGVPREGAKASLGVLAGSPNAVTLVGGKEGDTVRPAHAAPVVVDSRDPESVLAALREWSQVVSVERA
ncbi:hypothetical protein ACQP25_44895 (plasmid) [Microtetraspora malaysiensis]|uniref:hypothetical protein n=1 Tax=Microtetraspora malaysiensis TaxID=161358 RepID=UPI003D8F7E5E